MVFEVKATHRVASTGHAACEVHPDVFVDEWGQVFVTDQAVIDEADVPGGIRPHRSDDPCDVFVVGDDAIELVIDWIEVLSGDQRRLVRVERRVRGLRIGV